MRLRHLCVGLLIAGLLPVAAPALAKKKKNQEPDKVVVQHILVSFARKSGKKVERSKKEAEALADELLERARAGEDFDAMVKEYTDDQHPGTYIMTNRGAKLVSNGTARGDMVAKFGDVAFKLEVGEVGMAEYHGGLSPYGWHIIKRLE